MSEQVELATMKTSKEVLVATRSLSLPVSEGSSGSAEAKRPSGDAVVEQTEVDVLSDGAMPSEDRVHYKTLAWGHCGILMIAECISLGILALPHALATLGLIP